jgi:hypothetical protein
MSAYGGHAGVCGGIRSRSRGDALVVWGYLSEKKGHWRRTKKAIEAALSDIELDLPSETAGCARARI